MNNTYGIVRPTTIDVLKDVEIWYHYRPTRNSIDESFKYFKKIKDVTSILTNSQFEENDNIIEGGTDRRLPGMYNLSLPSSIFGKVGFYTIYIKPKEILCTIKDIGALAAYPDVSGIVLDMNGITEDRNLFANDNLVGYRVEYFDYENNGLVRQSYYRLITSNNFCEPMSQNLTSANTNANGYRYNDSASLSFMTLSPSTSPSFKSSQKPYIGSPNQKIVITNTKFDPICVEIEMCKNDFDTITTVLTGNQIRSLDNGLVTTYNENGEIFLQQEFSTIKDNYTTNDVYEVKKQRTDNIDNSVDYNGIMNV